MDTAKTNLILRVAKMYYEMKMSQQEIGVKENISKSTVSRLLKNAMDMGFVDVRVRMPEGTASDTESEMMQLFNLRKAVVLPGLIQNEEIIIQDVCTACASDLPRYIDNVSVVGVAWGRTMNVLVQKLKTMKREGVIVIQLNGGSSRALYETGATEIVRAFKNAVGGDGYLLPAPAIVDTPQISDMIKSDSQIHSVLQLAKRCKTAIFSVGAISKHSVLYELGCFSPLEYEAIEAKGAVGDVCSHFIDLNGNEVDERLNGRVVGASLDDIRNVENKILVAVGIQKAAGILGALRGGYADVLYTDENTAKKVLDLAKNS